MRKLTVLVFVYFFALTMFAESVIEPGFRAPAVDPDSFEPNNSATQYTNLSLSYYQQHSLLTLHNSTDQDWFRFYGELGKTYHFHSTGSVDTRVFLYNEAGTSLIASDDDSGLGTNFLLSVTVPSAGFYKVKIDGYGGAVGAYEFYYWWEWPPDSYEPDNSPAQSHWLTPFFAPQNVPHTIHSNTDQDWFKFSARRGKTYTFYSSGSLDTAGMLYQADGTTQLIADDDGAGYPNFKIEFTAVANQEFYLKVVGLNEYVGDYQLIFGYSAAMDIYESDDVVSDPTLLIVNNTLQSQSHSLHSAGDVDWFKFWGEAGKIYHFNSTGGTDTKIYLYSADGVTPIANDDDGFGDLNFNLVFTPTSNSYYTLKVFGHAGDIGFYEFYYYYTTSLPTPQNLTVNRSGDAFVLNWSPVPGALSYLIEVSANPYSGFQAIGNTTGLQWMTMSPDPKMFFRIRASTSPVQ